MVTISKKRPVKTGKKTGSKRVRAKQVPAAKKAQSTQFKPGESGNPSGRPKGSRNRASVIAEELLDGEGEAIMRRAIEAATAGEPVALRLCIDRILPKSRGRRVELDVPHIERAQDLVTACASVIDAAARGDITTGEAAEWMSLLDRQRKVIETADLAVRVELIEQEIERA